MIRKLALVPAVAAVTLAAACASPMPSGTPKPATVNVAGGISGGEAMSGPTPHPAPTEK